MLLMLLKTNTNKNNMENSSRKNIYSWYMRDKKQLINLNFNIISIKVFRILLILVTAIIYSLYYINLFIVNFSWIQEETS